MVKGSLEKMSREDEANERAVEGITLEAFLDDPKFMELAPTEKNLVRQVARVLEVMSGSIPSVENIDECKAHIRNSLLGEDPELLAPAISKVRAYLFGRPSGLNNLNYSFIENNYQEFCEPIRNRLAHFDSPDSSRSDTNTYSDALIFLKNMDATFEEFVSQKGLKNKLPELEMESV